MQKVFKYEIAETINLPAGAKIVRIGSQNGVNFIWALINEGAPTVARRFKVAATGQRIHEDAEFLGTWAQDHYIWHLFEEQAAQATVPVDESGKPNATSYTPTKAEQAEIDQELTGQDPADHGEIPPDVEEPEISPAEMEPPKSRGGKRRAG